MIKDILKGGLRRFRQFRARHAVPALQAHHDPKIKAIGDALDEALYNKFSQSELELVKSIEKRRSILRASGKDIMVIDYGAGSPGTRRTEEEMHNGVEVKSTVANVCRASKPKFWGLFLFKLIRKFAPSSCVELGTCVGISASYQAVALNINGKGKLVTLEGSPETAKLAEETLKGLRLQNASVVVGPFHRTLRDTLESSQPIDFFFNDGHHDYHAVWKYFREALPYLSKDAIVILDDISWSKGMRRAWEEIVNHERVYAAIDLRQIGIILLADKPASKVSFRIPL